MTEINKDEMERVVVGRRETCELEFPVSQPGTVLRWEFVTSDHGITFGWHLKEVHLTKSSNAISVVSDKITFIVSSSHRLLINKGSTSKSKQSPCR